MREDRLSWPVCRVFQEAGRPLRCVICLVAPSCTPCLDRFNLSPDFLTVMRSAHPLGATFSFACGVFAVHPPITGQTNGHHYPWR